MNVAATAILSWTPLCNKRYVIDPSVTPSPPGNIVIEPMIVEKAYVSDGLVNICDAVKASSSNYRNTQDFYSDFVADKVKKSVGGKIKETSLYEVFKSWFQLHHGKNVPRGRDLFEFMTNKFGKKVRGVWNDISIVYDDLDANLDEYDDN